MQRLAWARANPQDMMVAWSYTLARRFDSAAMRAAALTAAAGLALIAAFRHRRQPAIAYAAGIVGSLLASPYLHLYDFMLLFPAAWLLLRVAPAAWVLPPLLACYLFLLLSTHGGPGRGGCSSASASGSARSRARLLAGWPLTRRPT